MTRVTHLSKNIAGMASRTACGRNILRTPIADNYAGFKTSPHQCAKCKDSKFFSFMERQDADQWIPEAPDAWKIADDKLISSNRCAK